jgi:hypothetical protein
MNMGRYVLCSSDNGYIRSVIELIEPHDFTFSDPFWALVSATSSTAQFGGVWNGVSFDPPVPPLSPNHTDYDLAVLNEVSRHNAVRTAAIGSVTPAAVAAIAAVGASAVAARADHVHPVPAIAPATPSRALNTTFQPHATKQVLCLYGVQITCTASLTGGQNGRVRLLSDAASPPTTIRAEVQNNNSVSLAIALTAVNGQTGLLAYLCPAGHNVRLETANVVGTPSFTLISQTEIPIG